MKARNFLDVTLNLTTDKYQAYNKPDNNPLCINILSNHPPNTAYLKIFFVIYLKELTICQHIKSKNLYKNALGESGFNHKITIQQQKDISTVENNTKNRKKIYGLTQPTVLMF